MNYLVSGFGGREGCLGGWYQPTTRELLDENAKEMKRNATRLERQQARLAAKNTTLKVAILKCVKSGAVDEAKQKAVDFHHNRVSYESLGRQRSNIKNLERKLTEELQKVDIDRNLCVLVRVMGARLNVLNPKKFEALMRRYDELSTMEEMNDDTMTEFFATDLENAIEKTREGTSSDEQFANEIFSELGIDVLLNSVLPDTPLRDPNDHNRGPPGNPGIKEKAT